MGNADPVITNCLIYSGDRVVAEGSFQVLENVQSTVLRSSDGTTFHFRHFYTGSVCYVDISGERDGATAFSCALEIPINRSKIKWKNTRLGDRYLLQYRSSLERLSARRLKRMRGTVTKGPYLVRARDDAADGAE